MAIVWELTKEIINSPMGCLQGGCIIIIMYISFSGGMLLIYRGTEKHPPRTLTVGLCLGPFGGPRGWGVFLWARYPCISGNGPRVG